MQNYRKLLTLNTTKNKNQMLRTKLHTTINNYFTRTISVKNVDLALIEIVIAALINCVAFYMVSVSLSSVNCTKTIYELENVQKNVYAMGFSIDCMGISCHI